VPHGDGGLEAAATVVAGAEATAATPRR
jgi:hypothetical protein